MSPAAFAAELSGLGLRRASFILQGESLLASHPALSPLAAELVANRRDFDGHEAVFLELGQKTSSLLAAFLHRTVRGQGAGGVRRWPYATLGALLDDGLRLSRGMGRKNALAGLWWGGGKGIIAATERDSVDRAAVYEDYGRFVTSLRGYYVTAEDVGTQPSDMAAIFRTTRFVTCVPPELGGSGNPSFATARGVVSAMEAAVAACLGGDLAGRSVAVQGLGNVARAMIGELLERRVERIVASDIDARQLETARARFAADGARLSLRQVAADDTGIYREPVDVFAPSALGGVLNPETIPLITAKIVCGAANNQLLDDQRDDQLLADRGIVYVPDFVANRMGIVNCANEQYGVLPEDPSVLRHFDPAWDNSLWAITTRVLERARLERITTTRAANALADELGAVPHPLWPGRGQQIRNALVRERWHEH